MNQQDVKSIFAALTKRFGAREMKEGQDILAIEQGWVRCLGGFRASDVQRAVQVWCDVARYTRWPEAGEILEDLKTRGVKPEGWGKDNRPAYVKEANRQFADWHHGLLLDGYELNGERLSATELDRALGWMLGGHGQTFNDAGTNAWLRGMLPTSFRALLADYLDRSKRGNEEYQRIKAEKGLLAANTWGGSKEIWG